MVVTINPFLGPQKEEVKGKTHANSGLLQISLSLSIAFRQSVNRREGVLRSFFLQFLLPFLYEQDKKVGGLDTI